MFKKLTILFIVINIALSGALLYQDNLYFHTDIARDFLLIEEVVDTMKPTLIGPRSGGIPGVFHGPLWLYINLPAFVMGGGNPVVVGYFWMVLSAMGIGMVYWVGRRVFDEHVGLVSAGVFSAFSIPYVANMFNPYGAVLLSPLFLYLFYRYVQGFDYHYAVGAFFTLGLIIQFQMAFGVPLFVLALVYMGVLLWRTKKGIHLLSMLAVLPPLSTFILFELRNNFSQVRGVLNYISGKEDYGKVLFSEKVMSRLHGMFIDGLGLFSSEFNILALGVVALLGYALYVHMKKLGGWRSDFWKSFQGLVLYFYVGFWGMAFLFSGVIWGYYYWPFLPLIIIVLASYIQAKILGVKALNIALVVIVMLQMYGGLRFVQHSFAFQSDAGSWRFNKSVAEDVFADAPKEFGYFIYTPDQYGYTPRYAMNYAQKSSSKAAVPFEKKKETYLLIAPAPKNRPELNGVWWRVNQIKLERKPDEMKKYDNGFVIMKYVLTDEEIGVEADPNLIKDLIFR